MRILSGTRFLLALFVISLLSLLACSGGGDGRSPVEWIQDAAHPVRTIDPAEPLDDLAPFGQMVGGARVVALGESRHDIHEQFLLKHRLTRYLVEELGFTLFLLEESFVMSEEVNAFLLRGEGDAKRIVSGSANWFAWDTEEMVALLTWMRAHNESAPEGRRIRFYGFDVTDTGPAVQEVLDFLDRVDRPYRKTLYGKLLGIDLYSPLSWMETKRNYDVLSNEERERLTENVAALVERLKNKGPEYIEDSSEEEHEWVLRCALSAQEGQRVYMSGSRTEGGLIRDRAMAENALWVLGRAAPEERAVLWAHNAHIAKGKIEIVVEGAMETGPVADMVYHLGRELEGDVLSVAFSFTRSVDPYLRISPPQPESADVLLSQAGIPVFLLDLRSAPRKGPVRAWLERPVMLQMEQGYVRSPLAEAYDAVLFVQDVRRTRPNRSAIHRFRELGVQ